MQSRHSIELRQHQKLTLTPQLRQAIRLLQCSAQDLELEIAQALLDNPLLERVEEYDTEAAGSETDSLPDDRDFGQSADPASRARDSDDYTQPEAIIAPTLRQHLREQLRLTRAGERDRVLVELLIEELDDNGYLTTPLEDLADLLPVELDIDISDWKAALSLLQSFDPPGVGAASISECMLLQLRRLEFDVDDEVLACARQLANGHLEKLASGKLTGLSRQLGHEQCVLIDARRLLLRLNPKPGRNWATDVADYVRPEVFVRKSGGVWKAYLNPAARPSLKVDAVYDQIIRQHGDAGGEALRSRLREAHGLIKSVQQRFDTILRVASAVVEHQQAFFDQGEQALRPLVLRDIAQELQMHESTVSRSTRQKYLQTPWGVYELKYFFTTAVGLEDGDATSNAAVRSMIQELVESEPAGKPLSDNTLATKLAERGVVIARRTVAKYREAAGIPPAPQRRARARLDAAR